MVDSLIYSEYNGSTGNTYYFFDHSCTYDHDKCLGADSALVASHPYVSIYGYHIGCDVEEAPYLKKMEYGCPLQTIVYIHIMQGNI
jgi:hypothetical protein